MVGGKVVLIDFFTDVMNPPVRAVQENDGRAIGQRIDIHFCHQAMHQGIAKQGGFPVVARVAQHEGLKALNRHIGEDSVLERVDPILSANMNGEGLLRVGASPCSVDFKPGIQ